MRRFVRSDVSHDVILGAAAVLLVAIAEAGAGLSYLIVLSLLASTIWMDRMRRGREKNRAAKQP
jgi:hypothetical protein